MVLSHRLCASPAGTLSRFDGFGAIFFVHKSWKPLSEAPNFAPGRLLRDISRLSDRGQPSAADHGLTSYLNQPTTDELPLNI